MELWYLGAESKLVEKTIQEEYTRQEGSALSSSAGTGFTFLLDGGHLPPFGATFEQGLAQRRLVEALESARRIGRSGSARPAAGAHGSASVERVGVRGLLAQFTIGDLAVERR